MTINDLANYLIGLAVGALIAVVILVVLGCAPSTEHKVSVVKEKPDNVYVTIPADEIDVYCKEHNKETKDE